MNIAQKGCGCLFTLIFGTVFTGIGISSIIFFAKVITLDCKRIEPPTNQGQCQLSSQSILPMASQQTIIPIESISDARLDVSYDDEDNSKTYQVVLLTKAEESIPLTFYHSSGRSDKQRQVNQIKNFVSNTNEVELNIQQDDRMFGYIFGGVFAVVGIVVLFSPILAPFKALSGRR